MLGGGLLEGVMGLTLGGGLLGVPVRLIDGGLLGMLDGDLVGMLEGLEVDDDGLVEKSFADW